MREVAETHYSDDSGAIPTPLFGMVQFRRRKVLIKLVLEGTSRLIQGSHWHSLPRNGTGTDQTLQREHRSIG
jgi:hypothetical protein